MLNKEVIPARYLQNLSPVELLPHNEKYYQQCKSHIKRLNHFSDKITKDEVERLVLLQIRNAQLDGKRAEERLGDNHEMFVQKIIFELEKLPPLKIFKDQFQFPLYAFSLYLIGYAFFIFLLSAWFGYTVTEALLYPVPFSGVGLVLGGAALSLLFILLFRRRQQLKLVSETNKKELRKRETLNFIGIGLSFLIPYIVLRMQIGVFHIGMWIVLIIGIAGVLLARYRFLVTNTLPK